MRFWGSIIATLHRLSGGGELALALLATALIAAVGWPGDAIATNAGVLRVGTSGDYAPFSVAGSAVWSVSSDLPATPGNRQPASTQPAPTGFDPAVAIAYAKDRGLEIEWVRFRWPDLLSDLAADRFDVAMSGVTVRPDRSLAGLFSIPVCQSGALLLLDRHRINRLVLDQKAPPGDLSLEDLDQPAVRIAVNAGGHLERVTRQQFPNATLIPVPDNAAVLAKVLDGTANAAATDTQEAPSWLRRAPSLESWGPFTQDRKAYLVRPDRQALASDLDSWLQEREADGRLTELRNSYLSGEQARLATGLPALLAGVAERLALMPMVAEAKRQGGQEIEVPLREERVIEAGILRTRAIARARGLPAPDSAAVRAFFRAQIEAAKAIQRNVLKGPATMDEPPDLSDELRPALIRIGDRLAGLIVALPTAQALDLEAIRAMTRGLLEPQGLELVRIDAIASAVASLSSRRSAPGGGDAP